MKVLTASQIKTAEQNAVQRGIFSYAQLMKNAGTSAANEIKRRYDIKDKKILVICGNGNNGGDGLVIAANLQNSGADVSLAFPLGFPSTKTALTLKNDVNNVKIIKEIDDNFDFVIDALFGIGLNRKLTDEIAALIEKINKFNCVKIAVDLPSGVFCDGGDVSIAFKSDLTLTFTAYKICQLIPPCSKYCGKTVVLDIGLPVEEYVYKTIEEPKKIKREKHSHKGTFGTALLICGSYGMCGAEILATQAALRSGVGIAKAIVCDKNYTAFTSDVPEAVVLPVRIHKNGSPIVSRKVLASALNRSNALLIGCGLGQSKSAKDLIFKTLKSTKIPTVIDADGINAVASNINIIRKINAPVIITPHPAEMARLCNATVSDIESNRIKFAKEFAVENNCYLLLKGTNSIIATPKGEIWFNTTGNDGLSTGGSGDVLSGMIVSRLAQGYAPFDALANSVYLHGKTADVLSKSISTRAILPTDIIEGLKTISD